MILFADGPRELKGMWRRNIGRVPPIASTCGASEGAPRYRHLEVPSLPMDETIRRPFCAPISAALLTGAVLPSMSS